MSEPLTAEQEAMLRDIIREKAANGGLVSARNAERLLVTLDAVRSASPVDRAGLTSTDQLEAEQRGLTIPFRASPVDREDELDADQLARIKHFGDTNMDRGAPPDCSDCEDWAK